MDAWIEPLAKTIVFATALYLAVPYLIAIERAMADYVALKRLPGWTGIDSLLQPIRNELPMLFIARHQGPGESHAGIASSRSPTAAFMAAFGNSMVRVKSNAPSILPLAVVTMGFATIPFGYQLPLTQSSEPATSGAVALTVAPRLDIGLLAVLFVCGLTVFLATPQSDATRDLESIRRQLRNNLALGLSSLGVVLLSGSLQLEAIILQQAASGVWWIVLQPLGFVVFAVCAVAEPFRQRRQPDEESLGVSVLAHVDSDANCRVVFAQYLHLLAIAYLLVILYFGGWHLWWIAPLPVDGGLTLGGAFVRVAVLHCKVAAVVAGILWLRNAKPRLLDDGFLRLVSETAIPLAMLNFVTLAVLNQF